MIRPTQSTAAYYVSAALGTLLLSGTWNFRSHGYMIGQQYFVNVWNTADFFIATLFAGLLPAQIAGIGLVMGVRKVLGKTVHHYILLFAVVITLLATCLSHYMFWRDVRSLCCGATW